MEHIMQSVLPLAAEAIVALLAWLINHQAAVFFSQNKPATSYQYFSFSQPSATSQTNRLSISPL
jgi:hypothetical protein